MVIMPGARTLCAAKQDIVVVVDKLRRDVDDWIIPIVLFALLHLLLGSLATSEGAA
jgi:hypothetical protein